VATADLKFSLAQFVTFARTLKGDEKSEAQGFLGRFFRALGHDGVMEAGATFEFRVAKKPGSAHLELIVGSAVEGTAPSVPLIVGSAMEGTAPSVPRSATRRGSDGALPSSGKKFADLLWPERVLIEMKSRGAKLEKHYDQAFENWQLIVPNRPRYVILCNFDEFWIYDFNQHLFDPVERVFLRDLADSANFFAFLLPAPRAPVFGNNRVEVTRKAADSFASVFRQLIARGEDRTRTQRFILQLLVSVVAEDLGLLPDNLVTGLLAECAGRKRAVASPHHGTAGAVPCKTASKADPLAFLLTLNLTLAAKEKAGEPITPPGLPLPQTERAAFMTDDCVRVAER